jgi:hypothetical protein
MRRLELPQLPPRVTAVLGPAWRHARAVQGKVQRGLRRGLDFIDPNDDPEAEPLGLLPLLGLGIALFYSVWMFWHWKFQPMQDMGHHVGLSAVVADYSRPGSLYPALYERPDPLYANSLLYTVAGYSGKLLGVTRAVRVCMVFYVAGVPLANLFALRVFGRSAWPAMLSVPFVYNMNYVAGFSNLLFAAPFLVLSIPLLWRALRKPTWKRILLVSLCFCAVFLAHAHIFLWTGALAFAVTLSLFVTSIVSDPDAPPQATLGQKAKRRAKAAGKIAGLALLSVIPSLLLFYRWYQFAFGAGASKGTVTAVTTGWENNFGAYYKTLDGLFHDLFAYAAKITILNEDLSVLWKLGVLAVVAVGFSRLHRWKRPPVLELAWALTLASYFLLPEAIDTNPVVGSRQIGVSLWLMSALVCPVPAHVSRIARWIVIGGILWVTNEGLAVWYRALVEFEKTEANGLQFVLDAAPFRKTMHMVKVGPDTSKVFQWKPNWHVDKYYMADRFGQVPDNPAIVSTSSIRYKEGIDPHRVTWHSPDWAKSEEIWTNFDLVLVHGWEPTENQYRDAKKRGVRIRREGAWELWRTKGEWQEKGDGPAPQVPTE